MGLDGERAKPRLEGTELGVGRRRHGRQLQRASTQPLGPGEDLRRLTRLDRDPQSPLGELDPDPRSGCTQLERTEGGAVLLEQLEAARELALRTGRVATGEPQERSGVAELDPVDHRAATAEWLRQGKLASRRRVRSERESDARDEQAGAERVAAPADALQQRR